MYREEPTLNLAIEFKKIVENTISYQKTFEKSKAELTIDKIFKNVIAKCKIEAIKGNIGIEYEYYNSIWDWIKYRKRLWSEYSCDLLFDKLIESGFYCRKLNGPKILILWKD